MYGLLMFFVNKRLNFVQTELYVNRSKAWFPAGVLQSIHNKQCCQRDCCVKQIVEHPARIEYTVSRRRTIRNKYTIFGCQRQQGRCRLLYHWRQKIRKRRPSLQEHANPSRRNLLVYVREHGVLKNAFCPLVNLKNLPERLSKSSVYADDLILWICLSANYELLIDEMPHRLP